MADKRIDMAIEVGAELVKGTGEQVVKDAEKEINNASKGGRITIPVDISVPIDKTNKKLTKAQDAVARKISGMTRKGFSASKDDIDDLNKKLKTFTHLATESGITGKGKSNPVVSAIKQQVKELKSLYKARSVKFSQGAIDKALNESYRQFQERTGKKQKLAGIKRTGPKGFKRDFGFDTGVATGSTVRASDFSPYRSNWARQMKVSELASIKWMEDSLKQYKNNELANKLADEAIAKNRRKRGLSPQDASWEKAQATSNELAKILGGLEHNRINTSIDQFNQFLNGIVKFGGDADKNVWDSILLSLNKTFNRYASKGAIGATDGEIRGEGEGHATAMKALAGMINLFKKVSQQDKLVKIGEEEVKWTNEQARQLKALAKMDPSGREAEKYVNAILKKQEPKKETSTSKKEKEIIASNSKLQKELNDISKSTNETKKATERQLGNDKIANSRKSIADSKTEQISTEIKDIESVNANDGLDDEGNTQTLFNKIDKFKEDVVDIKDNTEEAVEDKKEEEKENDKEQKIEPALTAAMSSFIDNCPCEPILTTISDNVKLIADKIGVKGAADTVKDNLSMAAPPETTKALTIAMEKSGLPDLYRYIENGVLKTAGVVDKSGTGLKGAYKDKTDWEAIYEKRRQEEELNLFKQKAEEKQKRLSPEQESEVDLSKDLASAFKNGGLILAIKRAFGATDYGPNANSLAFANQEKIQDILNKRIETFGLANKDSVGSTGGKAQAQYRKALFGWGEGRANPFADLKLTKGINIDSKGITDALQTAIEKNQFKAQTGGLGSNLLIAGTMGLAAPFMPSLEKSRAEAEGLNSVMAEIRNTALSLLGAIQNKETALRGLEKSGAAKFNEQGMLTGGTAEATKLMADMEELKMSLGGVLAEANMVNQVAEDTGYDTQEIISTLGFAAPELKKCNVILQNLNAGLNKSGKALKFQTRAGEILNYTFQRIARHIGQTLQNWIMMLNPINLIKKAFQDFASYDVKWQRTMNVIKYNIRRILRPFMEWLAQQIVNIIGLINAVVKGIGKVFGYDWDLFDRVAADAEKTREELEAAANVSAGFDELHDIGGESSSNAAMDLLNGDIYTPQWDSLYQGLEEFGKKIAEVFKGISDFFANADFWDWLAIGGAALLGFFALRWLIDWFSKGTNPLQSVADGFKSLEKSVGWALLIWAVSTLVDSLREFVDVVGQMETKQVAQALFVLAVALITVGAAIVGIIAAITLVIDGTLGTAALGILAIAAVIAAMGLVISSIALLMLAINELMKTIVELVKIIFENADKVVLFIQTIGIVITAIINTIGNNIVKIIESVANAIVTIWTPILTFIDKLIDKFLLLASIIAHEVGETIRSIVKTVGATIIAVIHEILNAIPNLLNAILRFCREIGPAIENSVDAVMRSITKLINFVISAVEYMINTLLIGGINGFLGKLPGVGGMIQLNSVQIARFVPQYEQGTNFVPNDGLAYLHQGEAVVPKKYNQLNNNGLTQEEKVYMAQMITVMRSLDNQMKQGINVNGQFVQRGSDLVAVVNKTKSQTGADLLSNVSYAR